jgi:hypothetical protein
MRCHEINEELLRDVEILILLYFYLAQYHTGTMFCTKVQLWNLWTHVVDALSLVACRRC